MFLKSDVAIGGDDKLCIQFASHAYNFSNMDCYNPLMQILKSQYTEKEGYYIRKPPKVFTFKDSGDTSKSCLSIQVKDEGCVMSADPKNKKVSE